MCTRTYPAPRRVLDTPNPTQVRGKILGPQGVEVAERATELLQSRTTETGRAMLVSREAPEWGSSPTPTASQLAMLFFDQLPTI